MVVYAIGTTPFVVPKASSYQGQAAPRSLMSRLLKSTAVALLAVATARGANAPCSTVTDAQCGDGFEKAHDVASALCINDPCETGLPSSADQDLCCRSLRWGPLVSVQVGTSRRQFSETTGTVWITVFGEHGATESMQLQQGFESGARDTVELKLDVDPGPITRVRLELEDGPGSTDGWLMSYLELKISDGDQCGTAYYFDATGLFLDRSQESATSTLDVLDMPGYGNSNSKATARRVGVGVFEPQAPSRRDPWDDHGEGVLGTEVQELDVARRLDTFDVCH